MNRSEKKKIIEKFAVHTKDTGSAQVQVAILTERINALQEHLLGHSKDNHSRKGLLEMVGKRRKHLNYLRLHGKESYEDLIKKLKLKNPKQAETRETVKRKVVKEKVSEPAKPTKQPAKPAKKAAKKEKKAANSRRRRP